ncbi:MAG: insulinase family protein, partial [Candidatus Tectomicrobia bacterium]|nr:insulinase family protein [Candidatus Tectomicrobia bacterium]
PYRIPVIGWMSDLENFTRDDLIRHYRTYYEPNNAFLIVVGDVEAERVLKLAKTYFGSILRGVDPPKVRTREPEQAGERRAVIRREAFLPTVVMAYHIPEYTHPHNSALKVLSQILARGKTSRLYKTLVYQGQIATSINASAEDRIDPSIFVVTCNLRREKSPEEAEVAIYQEMERLKEEPVTDLELEKAVNQAVSAFVFGQESMLGQAFFIGRYHSLGSYNDLNTYVEKIQAVTKEMILEVAKRYLIQENRSVVTLIPLPPKGRAVSLQ